MARKPPTVNDTPASDPLAGAVQALTQVAQSLAASAQQMMQTMHTMQQVVQGMEAIRAELIKALESHGVRLISPAVNDAFDPNQHQAISTMAARTCSSRTPPGTRS